MQIQGTEQGEARLKVLCCVGVCIQNLSTSQMLLDVSVQSEGTQENIVRSNW